MRSFAILSLLGFLGFVALALGQTPAQSGKEQPGKQQPGKEQPKSDMRSKMMDVDKFLKEFDKNNDGALNKEELKDLAAEFFDRMDQNKDGKLSRDELRAHARAQHRRQPLIITHVWIYEAEDHDLNRQDLQQAYDVLRKLDANNDGTIAAAEIRAARKDVVGKLIDARLKDLDANNDGKLSKDEAASWVGDDMGKIDQNKDGFLSREELMNAAMDRASGVAATENAER